MTRLLVTGASGFVGRNLLPRLIASGHDVVTTGRVFSTDAPVGAAAHHAIGEIGPTTDWTRALEGRETVVHLAAQVPLRGVSARQFEIVNDKGTERLAQQAATAGVARLIVLSSIFAAQPDEIEGRILQTPYGLSKRAAEAHVAAFSAPGRVGVSLRAPLVYGSGAVGNWALLTRLASLRVPLPFGAVHNRRSVVAVENLVDAICAVVADGVSPSGVFAVTDDGTVSIGDILSWLRAGMGRSVGMVNMPPGLMDAALRLLGQDQMAHSLLGDLVADSQPFKLAFGWKPPFRSRELIMAVGAAVAGTRKPE